MPRYSLDHLQPCRQCGDYHERDRGCLPIFSTPDDSPASGHLYLMGLQPSFRYGDYEPPRHEHGPDRRHRHAEIAVGICLEVKHPNSDYVSLLIEEAEDWFEEWAAEAHAAGMSEHAIRAIFEALPSCHIELHGDDELRSYARHSGLRTQFHSK